MRLPLLLVPAALMSACNVRHVDAPSLLPRPIETRSNAEPVRTAAAGPDAALDAEIATRRAAFETATAAFDATLARVRPMIAAARGDKAGSDAWIAAQAMLTDLGTARAASDSALSDIEQLAITRAAAGSPLPPALDALIAAGNATVAREGEAVTALQAELAPL